MRLAGARESDGGKPPDGLLFDDRFNALVTGSKSVDERFGLRITSQGDREIRIAGESRLGSNRNRQTTNERKRDTGCCELSADPTEGRFERCHPRLAPKSTRRPGASPASAPGRSWSHSWRRRSISPSFAWGCSRRRFWRMRSSPVLNKSRVVRNASHVNGIPEL